MKKITGKSKYGILLITFLLMTLSYGKVEAQLFQTTFKVNGRVIKINELNKKIEGIIDSASIPGLSFAVIDHNEVVFYHTYGFKQIEKLPRGTIRHKGKVNKRSLFEACSLSKSFFVFAVQQLVDQGVLNLDTPLYRYLTYPRLEHDERYKKITGRMILSHSSGIENWQHYNAPDKLEIVSEPGKEFVYSGEGYVYLSKVIEKLLGTSTENYMKELVYKPLKLKRTFTVFSKDGLSPDNYTVGHNNFMEPSSKEKNQSPNIAGLINTTANDYAKLLIGFFKNNNYLSQKRISEMTGADTNKHYPMMDKNDYWGPGFGVNHEERDTVLFQAGNNDVFKGFGFYSYTRKSGYVMFANGEPGDRIIKILDSLTTAQHHIFDFNSQYPNSTLKILNVYNKQGYLPALDYFNVLLSEKGNLISKKDFSEWANLFLEKEPKFSAAIAMEYENRYPSCQDAFILHGNAMVKIKRIEDGIRDYKKAIELDNTSRVQLENLIAQCYDLLKKEQ
ncbi:serine hydrolase domain-containing protein [Mucilaginibacter sp. SJ]|uniref:serine hydrolase domain-containing protein n=1 Tax=Mucilaginibacter sp. SJ TaxID=3029053 RepID=UPI0023A9D6F5|nr:serine hydrolase domain-containing protein [Mucilaginibacter sp. SJ]WEA01635.1 serine hydrolase [Mucilaginibacter sp. SJ]